MSNQYKQRRFLEVTERLTIGKHSRVDYANPLIAGGATITLDVKKHQMPRSVLFDTAAGTIITLPAATGSGAKFRMVVSVTATTNSHVIACVGTNEFGGSISIIDTDTADATLGFAAQAADNFDTITFNRTTTGLAAIGDYVEIEDVVAGTWSVKGVARASGTVATPFSAS